MAQQYQLQQAAFSATRRACKAGGQNHIQNGFYKRDKFTWPLTNSLWSYWQWVVIVVGARTVGPMLLYVLSILLLLLSTYCHRTHRRVDSVSVLEFMHTLLILKIPHIESKNLCSFVFDPGYSISKANRVKEKES